MRLLLGCAALLWLLHWIHLRADFPNNSPWMDYSKYTDEGWYGDAAISAHLFGHWHNPGGLNTAVALPVWPFCEWLVFLVTGVTVEAARGLALFVFAGNLALSYAVLLAARLRPTLAAFGVLLLASSMFLWAFSRLAILEPLFTFWILAAWFLSLRLGTLRAGRPDRRQVAILLAIGLLCCLALLTKTTAIFLLPSVALLLCASAGWTLRSTATALTLAVVGGAIPWLTYYAFAVLPHIEDFTYFFNANHWDQPTGLKNHLMAYWWAAHGVLWIGQWLVCVVLILLVSASLAARRTFREPLLQASLLAVAGVVFFSGWHDSPQPRYCMVLAYPVVFAAVLYLQHWTARRRWMGGLIAAALVVIAARDAYASAWFALHPEYTWSNAAAGVTQYVESHRAQARPLLLSISADEITLFTHLPGTCDDFGTLPLETRIQLYRPGWYAAWNELDDGTVDSIHEAGYRLQPVAHWHAFDDEDRDDLVLYRMIPLAGVQAAAPTRESAAP